MVLARKFTQAEDNDYEKLVSSSGRLRAVLDAFAEGSLPPEYDAVKLASYASSLIATQRMDGSFSASPDPDELAPDEKTDAHRFVTWIALAFLTRLQNDHPEEAADVKGLESSISAAFRSPSVHNLAFPESGPAEPVQQIEAALVLGAGNIPAQLKADPAPAPALAEALGELAVSIRKHIEEHDTVLPGGIDYKPLYTQALASLGED